MTAIITKSNLRKPVFINLSKCSIICYSFVYVTKCLNSVMMRFFIYNPDEIFIYLLLFLMFLHKIPLQKINLKNKWSEVWVSRKEYVDFLNILTLGQTVEYKKALKLVFKKSFKLFMTKMSIFNSRRVRRKMLYLYTVFYSGALRLVGITAFCLTLLLTLYWNVFK